MHRLTALTALALALAVFAPAVPAVTMSGIGARKCHDFLAAVDTGQKQAIDGYVSWAQGFISGFNWINEDERDLAVDPGSLTYWLVDYCGANRSDAYFEAVQAFVRRNAE